MDYKKLKIPIMVLFLSTGILLGTQIQRAISGDNLFESLKKFNDVLSLTQKNYVEDVETNTLVEAAINGMLEELDPHSVFIPKKNMERVEEEFRGDFEGIGIEFQIVNDTLTVVSAISGGPSEALGIQAGDRIVKIDGNQFVGKSNDDVRNTLRGKKGTKVVVSVKRNGEKNLIEYEIVRDKIPLYSVDASIMLDDKTGYVSVSRFAEKTTDELIEGLKKLKAQGMKQLVLDLRNNPGGYLNQAFMIADLFIDGDKKIVYTQGRKPEFNEEYYAGDPSEFEKTPIIVLINRGSASASEIVSGAIQDWDRGLIVGETSFGKGLVQRQFTLSDGSALRLTISKYFTPSGRLIQRDYGSKEEYYEEIAERPDSIEGDNMNHSFDADTTRPKFKTSGGRVVYGGGGITPDYFTKNDRLTAYTSSLLRKNTFYLFVLNYLNTEGKGLSAKYGENLQKFVNEYEISDAVLSDFIAFSTKEGVEKIESDMQKDSEYIKARLKATIARNYWKNDGWYSVILKQDNEIKTALGLFSKAKEMVSSR